MTLTGSKLNFKHFPAGPNGFFRAPVLLTGASEGLLIDGSFTYSQGKALPSHRDHRSDAHHDLYQSIGENAFSISQLNRNTSMKGYLPVILSCGKGNL